MIVRPARPLLVLLAGVLVVPLAARADDDDGDGEARRRVADLVEQLREGDAAARRRAIEQFSEPGAAEEEALRRRLAQVGPDVRFYLLFLLQSGDVRLERLVRVIVEGHEGDSGTYPEAREAYEEIRDTATPQTRAALVRLARRHAGRDGAKHARYRTVCLDLLWELLRRAEEPAGAEEAERLAGLCAADLNEALYELSGAFTATPPEVTFPTLRAALERGGPLARARAARVTGEAVPADLARRVVPALVALLDDDAPQVRLAGLQALDVLPGVEERDLIQAGVLVRDPDPDVAREALRIAAERGLSFVRESAEEIAADRTASVGLRQQAVRSLGLLGEPGSADVLRRLARPRVVGRELGVLAAWALGGVGDPKASERLLELIESDLYAQEDALYYGLARLGDSEALGELLERRGPRDGARRSRAIAALGRCTEDLEAAAELLGEHVDRRVGRATRDELQQVVRALADLDARGTGEAAREALARIYLREVDSGDARTIDLLLPLLGSVGGPEDDGLRGKLSTRLSDLVTSGSVMRRRRRLAADALSRVDPPAARSALRRVIPRERGGSEQQREHVRHLARSLARAGDGSLIEEAALPLSRRQVEAADAGQRSFYQNSVGIDLLYARRLEEARLEFRRMLWCDPRDHIAAYNVACGYSLAGRVDDALRYLRRSIRHGYDDPRHMVADPDLDPLHEDPRFQRLVRRLFLAEETGLPFPKDQWPRGR